MSASEEPPGLGRAEPWLRLLGLAIWAFIGVSRSWSAGGRPGAWVLAWAVYGGAYAVVSLSRRVPRPLTVALLGVETLAAAAMPHLGLKEFEGLMMSVVVAQVPTVLSLRASLAWTLAQAVPLYVAVTPLGPRSGLEIFGAYGAFSAFALLVYYLNAQERRARQAAANANADLVTARALVVERTREGERLRISRELHDSLGHHLTALRIQLDLASRLPGATPSAPLLRAQEISRDALTEVRRVVTQMRAPEPLDFAAALRALAGGVPTPRIHIPSDVPAISDSAHAQTLFRCAQEAITNSLKHASAKNIWVELSRTAEGLELRVRDDGRGASRISGGHGLAGMRERLEGAGGTLELELPAGAGFGLRMRVPDKGPTS
jgi:signal transduction histidine kinase